MKSAKLRLGGRSSQNASGSAPGLWVRDAEAGLRLAKAVQGVFFDVAEADYPFPSTYITSAVGPGNYALPAWPARVACGNCWIRWWR